MFPSINSKLLIPGAEMQSQTIADCPPYFIIQLKLLIFYSCFGCRPVILPSE